MLALLLACQSPNDGRQADDTGTTFQTVLGAGTGALEPDASRWEYVLGQSEQLTDPRDLGFDPDGNLWIANRVDDHTFIVANPATKEQTIDRREDGYAMHFMEETAAF